MDSTRTTCVTCGLAFWRGTIHTCPSAPRFSWVLNSWQQATPYRDSDPHVPESKYPFQDTEIVSARNFDRHGFQLHALHRLGRNESQRHRAHLLLRKHHAERTPPRHVLARQLAQIESPFERIPGGHAPQPKRARSGQHADQERHPPKRHVGGR